VVEGKAEKRRIRGFGKERIRGFGEAKGSRIRKRKDSRIRGFEDSSGSLGIFFQNLEANKPRGRVEKRQGDRGLEG